MKFGILAGVYCAVCVGIGFVGGMRYQSDRDWVAIAGLAVRVHEIERRLDEYDEAELLEAAARDILSIGHRNCSPSRSNILPYTDLSAEYVIRSDGMIAIPTIDTTSTTAIDLKLPGTWSWDLQEH